MVNEYELPCETEECIPERKFGCSALIEYWSYSGSITVAYILWLYIHSQLHMYMHMYVHTLVMCITKAFHITYHGSSYSRYEYISWYDVTYITYMAIIMKEQVCKQVIIMNYIWLICTSASCLMFKGTFDNSISDSSKTLTIPSFIFRKAPKNRAKTVIL